LHLGDDEALGLLPGVAEVELAVGFEVGVESEAVEAFLEFAIGGFHGAGAEIEEDGGGLGGFVIGEDEDLAALEGEELAAGAVVGDLDGDGEGGFQFRVEALELDEIGSGREGGGGEEGEEEGAEHGVEGRMTESGERVNDEMRPGLAALVDLRREGFMLIAF
jgi:hypothetical protein